MTFPTDYQYFIHLSRYARWNEEAGRREDLPETVARYLSFFNQLLTEKHDFIVADDVVLKVHDAILNLEVMPSMRALMTAGPALSRDHIAGYNCAYRAIDDMRAFDEMIFILMCGTGVGFSVERQYVNQLPRVPDQLDKSPETIVVRDSKRGWAEAYRKLISMLYAGWVPGWNTDEVREAGAKLVTMGGRASGPQPLIELFEFTVRIFENARGRKLTSIECHDIACKIGDCVVMGGVRRSALISLSNLSDQRMRDAKSGQWWETAPYRALANNSIAFTERPEVGQFMAEWLALYDSKSGERGIFNREAAIAQAIKSGRRTEYDFGTNPCSEIILRSKQFCNLTEVVAREEDTLQDLRDKVRLATTLGTWQACLTDYRYIGDKWKTNCEEERLLGVSITGIMDSQLLQIGQNPSELSYILQDLKEYAIQTNREWAALLNIMPATAITCVKPSGTVSQLVNSSSGIHPRYAKRYVRRVIMDNKDPMTQFMIEEGFPHEASYQNPDHNTIFSFPIESPTWAVTRDEVPAVKQLEHWKLYQDHWCEHKPSVTINVKESEWPGVGAWVWEHFDEMSGVAFLPHADHIYKQAPYEMLEPDEFDKLDLAMPRNVDWSKLQWFEQEDTTKSSHEFACVGGSCEL